MSLLSPKRPMQLWNKRAPSLKGTIHQISQWWRFVFSEQGYILFLGPSGQNELGFTSTQSKIFDSSHSSWFDGRSYFLPKWLLLLNFYPIEVKTCADDLSSDSESGKIGFIACAPFFSSTWASARCTWLAPEQVLRSPCFPPFSVAAPLVWPGFPTDWATWLSGTWHLASQRQKSHRNPLVNRTLALVGEEANCSWSSCCFSFFFSNRTHQIPVFPLPK